MLFAVAAWLAVLLLKSQIQRLRSRAATSARRVAVLLVIAVGTMAVARYI